MWIENKNLKPMQFKNKDVFLDIKIFNNIKYKWGGKTFKGLDCSACARYLIII
jgi:cell wall-associated NlpC family hydrolase